jgi:type I restriction-modification system DNA methylase subunit
MSLFQKSVEKKYLNELDSVLIDKKYKEFQDYFGNPSIQENIRNSKEEQFQEGFLREIFVSIFGYTLNPQPNFNLTTELKNIANSKKADGAILKGEDAIAVIELKGTDTTDLDKIETQAFGYKNHHPKCVYVITSNFEKLRFYIQNAVDHIDFDLFNLTREQFSLMWLCLAKDNLLNGLPQKIKESSLLQEENITKKLYADYSKFREAIYNNLVKNNPETDKLLLFKKTQKLLDRFLFIFFAEDRLLLPPNSISEIVKQWTTLKDELDEYVPLYDRFKKYFGYMNTGYKGKKYDIYAYNGGLFAPDEILDNISIDDEILHKHTLILSQYDFETDVDVNILGHIFEHSLGEIENVQAEIKGEKIDTQKTRRKKDGIFYTPKYITKYIVENTVGKLCEEKRTELDIVDEEYAKGRKNRKKDTIKTLDDKLTDYRNWLLSLTILDPACGSGAFLNQALDFLITEHRKIDDLRAQLFGSGLVFSDITTDILEKNIYGVDLNEESVEIAKLSLWLRTAQKGRKLNKLNNNIKCGNSLIDDPEVAGEKAFNWLKEFPEIFARGGFDVVIGNPPYVGEKGHADIFESLKKVPKWLEFYRRRSNTYYFFIKHGIELLKDNGIQSLIIPREFVSADWANKVRASILNDSTIISIVDFNDLKVFEDAGTTSLILTQQKKKVSNSYNFVLKSLRDSKLVVSQLFDTDFFESYSTSEFDNVNYKSWNFYQDTVDYNEKICLLSKYFDISQGLVTGADKVTNKHITNNLIDDKYLGRGIFILQKGIDFINKNNTIQLNIDGNWVSLNSKESMYIKPFIKTENLNKWFVSDSDYSVIYIGSNELEGQIKNYLMQFSGVLLNRSTTIPEDERIILEDFENFTIEDIKTKYSSAGAVQKIMRRKLWWLPLYERADVPFDEAKIIVNTKNMDKFTFSSTSHYSSGGGAGGQNFIYLKSDQIANVGKFSNKVDFTKFINAVLNSSFIQKHISDGQYNQLSTEKISDLPIIEIDSSDNEQVKFYKLVIEQIDKIIFTYTSINELQNKVIDFINGKFKICIIDWYDKEFSDFIILLDKSDIKLSLAEQSEWMQYFNEQKEKVQNLKLEIESIENKIDQMICGLYGLKKEELKIVEESK